MNAPQSNQLLASQATSNSQIYLGQDTAGRDPNHDGVGQGKQNIHHILNIGVNDYSQGMIATTYLRAHLNIIKEMEVTTLSFMSSEIHDSTLNYISLRECNDMMLADDVFKPYIMIHIISETSLKDYKKSGSLEMEKFVQTCKHRGFSRFVIVFCPEPLDPSLRKAKTFDSRLSDLYVEIQKDVESKCGIAEEEILCLFDSDSSTPLEFEQGCQVKYIDTIRIAVQASIEERIAEIETPIYAYSSQKNQPGWNYQKSLLQKERLIRLLNSLGMLHEALQQYEEYNNTIQEQVLRGKINLKEELHGIEDERDSVIPIINSNAYDNLKQLEELITGQKLPFFKFYQLLIRRFLVQMSRMQFIQELMERLQYFLRFIKANVFSQMDCSSESVQFFQHVWNILTINQIIELFVNSKAEYAYAPMHLNDIDYNIIIFREIQLKEMARISLLLFGISIPSLAIQSVEAEFTQLQSVFASHKLHRLKSIVVPKDISQLKLLQNTSDQQSFFRTFTDLTLFFTSYTKIVSDQIISLGKLEMYRKQFVYQINLLKFKILAREVKIPQSALTMYFDEQSKIIEAWPSLYITGLIYQIIFYKNHCVAEKFKQCSMRLLTHPLISLEQRNFVLSILKDDTDKQDEEEDIQGDKSPKEDESPTLLRQDLQYSTIPSNLQKTYLEVKAQSAPCLVSLEKLTFEKLQFLKIFIANCISLIFAFFVCISQSNGRNYECKLQMKKLISFSLESGVTLRLKFMQTDESPSEMAARIDSLCKTSSIDDTSRMHSYSGSSVESPLSNKKRENTFSLDLQDCKIEQDDVIVISRQLELNPNGCFVLVAISLFVGHFKFPCRLGDSIRKHIHKFNKTNKIFVLFYLPKLPTLRMSSLIEKGRIEIPYYHEFPILISIADHDFQKSHSRLLVKQDQSKLLVSPKCLFLVPCSKGGQRQFEETEGIVNETGEIQLPTNDINKAVVVIYLKVIGSTTIDFGSFTDLSATLISDGSPLESVQEKIILSHFYELTIKQLDIFYHINLTNMSEFPITFISQNSSQSETSKRNPTPLLTGESIAATIDSSKEKVFVLFGFAMETLLEVSKELFVDDFAFLGEFQTSKLITENEISKDTILKDSTRINHPKVEIFVDNRSSYCLQNEVLTIDLQMRVLPQTDSSSDQTFFTLLASTKPDCSYLLLGQTQVYLQKQGTQASWTIQILPFECGVFALPDFEVTQHQRNNLENTNASSIKLSENAFILKYYAQPSIAVTSDSSKIKNSCASFV